MARIARPTHTLLLLGTLLLSSCSPRVQVEVPDKPININLNVKIDHEVRVKIDRDLDSVISPDSKLF